MQIIGVQITGVLIPVFPSEFDPQPKVAVVDATAVTNDHSQHMNGGMNPHGIKHESTTLNFRIGRSTRGAAIMAVPRELGCGGCTGNSRDRRVVGSAAAG